MVYAQFAPLKESILKLRNLDPAVAQRFGIRWDTENKAMTLPIVTPLGELRGWQCKKTGNVWSYPTGVKTHDTFFGIERAFASTALIVESPSDVARFHSVYDGIDINCLGAFGANLGDEQLRLLSRRFDKVIIALDNDDAGRYHTKRLAAQLPSLREGTWFWVYEDDAPKDIGEMSNEQILDGLQQVSTIRRS